MPERRGLIASDLTDALKQAFCDTANIQPQKAKGIGTGCVSCDTDSVVREVIDIARTTDNYPGLIKPRTSASRVELTRAQASYVVDELAKHMPLLSPWVGYTPGLFERTKVLIQKGRTAYKPSYR